MKQKFAVSGMECEHCRARVDKAVRGLSGIQDVQVSLEEQSMVVDYDAAIADPKGVIEAVEEAGYGAEAML